jgi:tryptophan halogenase
MKVKKICILGGGTAGFSFASLMSRYKELTNYDLDVTVVYSSSIGNIGVGESTLLSINDYFHFLGLKDEDWMKECNATYKTSISFENFYKKGYSFHYPFGDPSFINDPFRSQKWFEMKDKYPDIFTQDTYARYIFPHARLNETNKLTDSSDIPGFDFNRFSAYHFDTNLLAKVLKKYSKDRGVKFVDDVYQHSVLDSKGNIEKIVCENGEYDADLFIDCSGFKSLLLEEVIGEKFIDFNETLINNRVVRAKIPYTDKEKQLKNYTNCVALDNGWCWEIPLWDCLSVGYVHSLKFTSEEDIKKEFIDFCYQRHNISISDEDISIINYKTGRHEKAWSKNVIGVGLSYGFLEPLESTGILTLLVNGFRALEMLSKREFFYTKVDQDIFNYSVNTEVDSLRGFIEIHYAFSSRDDSDYWRYVTEEIEYPKHRESTYFDIMFRTVAIRNYMDTFTNNGAPYIMAGLNYTHYSPAFNKILPETEELKLRKEDFLKEDEYFYDMISAYPSTSEFLKQKIYK